MGAYVYVYLDPRYPGTFEFNSKRNKSVIYSFSYKPFYVGKGRNARLYDHLWGNAANSYNDSKFYMIRDIVDLYGKEEFKKYILLYQTNLDDSTAYELEIDMIESIGRIVDGGTLTNILVNSRIPPDPTGIKRDESYRKKMSTARSGQNNPTAIFTDEQAKSIYTDSRDIRTIADEYGVSTGRIRDIKLGLYYASVTGYNDGILPALPNTKYLNPRYITDYEIDSIKYLKETKGYTYKEIQNKHNFSLDFLLKLKRNNYERHNYKHKDRYKVLSHDRKK
jgi:hypothetical protein